MVPSELCDAEALGPVMCCRSQGCVGVQGPHGQGEWATNTVGQQEGNAGSFEHTSGEFYLRVVFSWRPF